MYVCMYVCMYDVYIYNRYTFINVSSYVKTESTGIIIKKRNLKPLVSSRRGQNTRLSPSHRQTLAVTPTDSRRHTDRLSPSHR